MKKLIAILVVFALVAGAAFAQGQWSFGGNARVGTIIGGYDDQNGDFGGEGAGRGTARLNPNGDWNLYGELGANYNHDSGFRAGLTFKRGDGISSELEYNGENYKFKISGGFVFNTALDITGAVDVGGVGDLTGEAVGGGSIGFSAGDLWGEFNFLDGMLQLVASHVGGPDGFWKSSDKGGGGFAQGGNMITIDVKPSFGDINLSAGVQLVDFFGAGGDDSLRLALSQTLFGVKADMGIFNVALNLKLADPEAKDAHWDTSFADFGTGTSDPEPLAKQVGFYAGVEANGLVDGLSLGASFRTDKNFAFGLGFGAGYSLGDLGFGLNVALNVDHTLRKGLANARYAATRVDKADIGAKYVEDKGVLAIKPNVNYKLNDSLKFELGVELTADLNKYYYYDGGSKELDAKYNGLEVSITPSADFDFKGSGSFGDGITGMRFKYNVRTDTSKVPMMKTSGWVDLDAPWYSTFEVLFRWAF